mmetsp:Transcript_102695/g.306747  ORF Transcript_102695/g.306747 Transcript_102695/m.306747 type:complete len:247 (+) Transcript_102695:1302-2042(+)
MAAGGGSKEPPRALSWSRSVHAPTSPAHAVASERRLRTGSSGAGEWRLRTCSSRAFTCSVFSSSARARPALRSCWSLTAASSSSMRKRSLLTSRCKSAWSSGAGALPAGLSGIGVRSLAEPSEGPSGALPGGGLLCPSTSPGSGPLRRRFSCWTSSRWASHSCRKSSICCSRSCRSPAMSSSSLCLAAIINAASSSLVCRTAAMCLVSVDEFACTMSRHALTWATSASLCCRARSCWCCWMLRSCS